MNQLEHMIKVTDMVLGDSPEADEYYHNKGQAEEVMTLDKDDTFILLTEYVAYKPLQPLTDAINECNYKLVGELLVEMVKTAEMEMVNND